MKKQRINLKRIDLSAYLLIMPSTLIIIIFLIIPIVRSINLSFTDAVLLNIGNAKFIGLANYGTFFSKGIFQKVIIATMVYVIGGVSLTYFIGLIFAVLLNQKFKGRGIVRAILILPWAVPQVVLVIIWKWMLNPQNGVINYLLNPLVPKNFSWFEKPTYAMIAILLATAWKQYPIAYVIILAGLQTIPDELYEAASVDGASAVKKFIHITMPGLAYVTKVLILLMTIWHFGNFVIIWLMTKGGPNDRTAVFTVFTYLNSFKFSKLGFGAAIGTITFLISLIFSIGYYIIFIRQRKGVEI